MFSFVFASLNFELNLRYIFFIWLDGKHFGLGYLKKTYVLLLHSQSILFIF